MDRVVMAAGEWRRFAGIHINAGFRLPGQRIVSDRAAKAHTAQIDTDATTDNNVAIERQVRITLYSHVYADITVGKAVRRDGETVERQTRCDDLEHVEAHGSLNRSNRCVTGRADRQVARADVDVLDVDPGGG